MTKVVTPVLFCRGGGAWVGRRFGRDLQLARTEVRLGFLVSTFVKTAVVAGALTSLGHLGASFRVLSDAATGRRIDPGRRPRFNKRGYGRSGY